MRELGLSLVDIVTADGEHKPVFFFQNRRVSVTEIIDAFRLLVPRIRKDMAPLRGMIPTYKQPRPSSLRDDTFLGSYACYKTGQ